ncbi:MAG: hypothetical protein K0U45_05205 [Alphaproteobacteria bacterium]|nr:hypothetical protein [Alphaproteobacteria bacterium]
MKKPTSENHHPSPRLIAVRHIVALIGDKKQPAWNTEHMSERDRNFTHLLYKGILRHYYPLQSTLKLLAKRPPTLHFYHTLLLAGLYELLILEKQDFAVVNSYTQLAKKKGASPQVTGFINAILREVSNNRQQWQKKIANFSPLPDWLDKRWRKNFAPDDYQQMINSVMQTPKLGITVKQNPQQWCEVFQQAGKQASHLFADTLMLDFDGKISALDGYDKGEWWVQNISSYLAAHLLGNVSGKNILDLCAAPGGKAAYLANKQAKLTVLDNKEKRMQRLQENFTRLKLENTPIIADMLTYQTDMLYDAILLDAPCTALGTLRHNPDILLTRSNKDITLCAQTQKLMLTQAWQWLKPSGMMIYAVCSLEPEEGIDIITNFLQANEDAELSFIAPTELPDFVPKKPKTNHKIDKSTLRLMPYYHVAMDGFFIARLYKRSQ